MWRIPVQSNKGTPEPEYRENSEPELNLENDSEEESKELFEAKSRDQAKVVTIACPNNWCSHITQVPKQKTAVAVFNMTRYKLVFGIQRLP